MFLQCQCRSMHAMQATDKCEGIIGKGCFTFVCRNFREATKSEVRGGCRQSVMKLQSCPCLHRCLYCTYGPEVCIMSQYFHDTVLEFVLMRLGYTDNCISRTTSRKEVNKIAKCFSCPGDCKELSKKTKRSTYDSNQARTKPWPARPPTSDNNSPITKRIRTNETQMFL